MLKAVRSESPETPENTIHGSIHTLLKSAADISKIARGTYRLSKFDDGSEATLEDSPEVMLPTVQGQITVKEVDFYAPFAEWLKDELDEVNECLVLGGNLLKGKWGTPDVIGVLKPRKADLIKFSSQVVSAEIKVDPSQPITAFGQAMAYRLFSHKSYMVMPNTTLKEDLSRLEALAIIFGLGLVTFTVNKEAPEFTLRVRAISAQPDMFYLNQMAKRLSEVAETDFERLF